jgi:hypothetical protein
MKENPNWYEPEGQVIPEDQIPEGFRRIESLPGGKTQVIDTRYVYRYWPDIKQLCPCINKLVDELSL